MAKDKAEYKGNVREELSSGSHGKHTSSSVQKENRPIQDEEISYRIAEAKTALESARLYVSLWSNLAWNQSARDEAYQKKSLEQWIHYNRIEHAVSQSSIADITGGVRGVIPESRLAQYGDFRYDLDRESLFNSKELVQFSSTIPCFGIQSFDLGYPLPKPFHHRSSFLKESECSRQDLDALELFRHPIVSGVVKEVEESGMNSFMHESMFEWVQKLESILSYLRTMSATCKGYKAKWLNNLINTSARFLKIVPINPALCDLLCAGIPLAINYDQIFREAHSLEELWSTPQPRLCLSSGIPSEELKRLWANLSSPNIRSLWMNLKESSMFGKLPSTVAFTIGRPDATAVVTAFLLREGDIEDTCDEHNSSSNAKIEKEESRAKELLGSLWDAMNEDYISTSIGQNLETQKTMTVRKEKKTLGNSQPEFFFPQAHGYWNRELFPHRSSPRCLSDSEESNAESVHFKEFRREDPDSSFKKQMEKFHQMTKMWLEDGESCSPSLNQLQRSSRESNVAHQRAFYDSVLRVSPQQAEGFHRGWARVHENSTPCSIDLGANPEATIEANSLRSMSQVTWQQDISSHHSLGEKVPYVVPLPPLDELRTFLSVPPPHVPEVFQPPELTTLVESDGTSISNTANPINNDRLNSVCKQDSASSKIIHFYPPNATEPFLVNAIITPQSSSARQSLHSDEVKDRKEQEDTSNNFMELCDDNRNLGHYKLNREYCKEGSLFYASSHLKGIPCESNDLWDDRLNECPTFRYRNCNPKSGNENLNDFQQSVQEDVHRGFHDKSSIRNFGLCPWTVEQDEVHGENTNAKCSSMEKKIEYPYVKCLEKATKINHWSYGKGKHLNQMKSSVQGMQKQTSSEKYALEQTPGIDDSFLNRHSESNLRKQYDALFKIHLSPYVISPPRKCCPVKQEAETVEVAASTYSSEWPLLPSSLLLPSPLESLTLSSETSGSICERPLERSVAARKKRKKKGRESLDKFLIGIHEAHHGSKNVRRTAILRRSKDSAGCSMRGAKEPAFQGSSKGHALSISNEGIRHQTINTFEGKKESRHKHCGPKDFKKPSRCFETQNTRGNNRTFQSMSNFNRNNQKTLVMEKSMAKERKKLNQANSNNPELRMDKLTHSAPNTKQCDHAYLRVLSEEVENEFRRILTKSKMQRFTKWQKANSWQENDPDDLNLWNSRDLTVASTIIKETLDNIECEKKSAQSHSTPCVSDAEHSKPDNTQSGKDSFEVTSLSPSEDSLLDVFTSENIKEIQNKVLNFDLSLTPMSSAGEDFARPEDLGHGYESTNFESTCESLSDKDCMEQFRCNARTEVIKGNSCDVSFDDIYQQLVSGDSDDANTRQDIAISAESVSKSLYRSDIKDAVNSKMFCPLPNTTSHTKDLFSSCTNTKQITENPWKMWVPNSNHDAQQVIAAHHHYLQTRLDLGNEDAKNSCLSNFTQNRTSSVFKPQVKEEVRDIDAVSDNISIEKNTTGIPSNQTYEELTSFHLSREKYVNETNGCKVFGHCANSHSADLNDLALCKSARSDCVFEHRDVKMTSSSSTRDLFSGDQSSRTQKEAGNGATCGKENRRNLPLETEKIQSLVDSSEKKPHLNRNDVCSTEAQKLNTLKDLQNIELQRNDLSSKISGKQNFIKPKDEACIGIPNQASSFFVNTDQRKNQIQRNGTSVSDPRISETTSLNYSVERDEFSDSSFVISLTSDADYCTDFTDSDSSSRECRKINWYSENSVTAWKDLESYYSRKSTQKDVSLMHEDESSRKETDCISKVKDHRSMPEKDKNRKANFGIFRKIAASFSFLENQVG